MNILHLHKTINRYNGLEYICGVNDCNLMVLEIHEPDAFNILNGRFKTILGGVRNSEKLLGDSNLYDLLMNTLDYKIITNPKMIQIGDVILHKNNLRDAYISIGYGKAFGVNNDKRFGVITTTDLNEHYIIRHK